MFETVKWHDGSPISVADFVMGMIINFDLGNPDSPYYDESKAPDLDQFLSAFKGIRIVSTDPLVIEHYGDNPSLDENPFTHGGPVLMPPVRPTTSATLPGTICHYVAW